ncbi:MAG: cardiolipin synthase [Woeseiaceae bacterium]|nr:cardiolipin synthase [Woeseiaceae bacterium]
MIVQVTELAVYLLASLHIVLAVWSVYHILLYKRDTRAATGWIMASLFIPYGGPAAYYFFGINRVRTRARGFRQRFYSVRYEARRADPVAGDTTGRGLQSVGERITGRRLSSNNSVDALYNGEQAYPAMLEAINTARHRVLLATYILKTDQTGDAFARALAAAADRGVDVKVLVDGVGELYSWPRPSKLLKRLGVPVGRFLPPRLLPPSIYVNLRNHRKLLIVDNDLAFAGGMNISDDHAAIAGHERTVTDVHFRFRGPVVDALAAVFGSDWLFATREEMDTTGEAPPVAEGSALCRVIPDGPDEQLDALALTIQSVVSGAAQSVDVMTPYFLPSRELMAALQSAALRGVRVRIVLPGKNNLFYMHWANRNLLAELLEWGIAAYYQPAPFCHAKLLCIDDNYSLVGSANLDPRSLRLNFELGVEVFCEQLSTTLRTHIAEVIASSRPISSEELAQRSLPVRLRDSFVSLFSPYL